LESGVPIRFPVTIVTRNLVRRLQTIQMKRLFLAFTLVALVVGMGATAAFADTNQITLSGAPATQPVVFTGTGGSTVNLQLGSCGTTTCTVSGNGATGNGTLSFPGKADWSLTSGKGSLTLTETPTTGVFNVHDSDASGIAFCLGGTGAVCDGSLLTGHLDLLTIQQVAGTKTADFNTFGVANLVLTGGSLESAFSGAGGITTVKINFRNSTDLSLLFGTTGSVSGTWNDGSITPTPEPSSMLLMGSGLVAFGGLLRRKIKA
jgi:hypothetical protein